MKIVMLGAPGTGKGTYASRLSNHFNIPHISTGDIFREHIKNNTEIGKEIKEYINQGQLAPDELTIKMLKERIQKDDCFKGFILDGFPRTLNQAEELDNIIQIDKVINMVAPDQVILDRLNSRRSCKECGEIFNILSLKPKVEGKCDKCGGELFQRNDDKIEIIQKRLDSYKELTKPLEDHYKEKGVMIPIFNERADAPINVVVSEIINKIER